MSAVEVRSGTAVPKRLKGEFLDLQMVDAYTGAPLCWRRKGGAERNALGRSRGGFSTKINARTNAEGLPIGLVITPGQAHDVTAFPALMQEVDCDPEQLLGDKGYDGERRADQQHKCERVRFRLFG